MIKFEIHCTPPQYQIYTEMIVLFQLMMNIEIQVQDVIKVTATDLD